MLGPWCGERNAGGRADWALRDVAGAGVGGAACGSATVAQSRAAAGEFAADQPGGPAAPGSPGALGLGVRGAAGPGGAVWRVPGRRGPSLAFAGRPPPAA